MATSLIYLVLMAAAASAQQMINCQKINSCSCRSPHGVIDLSPLDARDPNNPRFKNIQGQSTERYQASYNPCSSYSENSPEQYCQNVAACLYALGSRYTLGSQDTAKFVMDPKTGLEIQYKGVSKIDSMTRTGHVRLVCDPNTEADMTAPGNHDDPDGSLNFIMTLKSRHCCPNGNATTVRPPPPRTTRHWSQYVYVDVHMNTGTLLCIVSVLLIPLLYLVGGILYHRCRRGSTQVKTVPKHEFWVGSPTKQ